METLTKTESETSKEYGSKPEDRSAEDLLQRGIVILNKPSGPSSHQASDYVKKILNINKAGHSGTLDPGVSGVLPVALSKATKVVAALLPAGKEYVCLMHLHKKVDEDKIRKAFEKFKGEIKQLPPKKCAVKRVLRKRTIYYSEIIEIEEQDVLFKMGCQAGTYVRKYVHDFGLKLNTNAHMAELVRTKAGPFTYKEWITLHDLKDAYVVWKEKNDDSLLRKVIRPMEDAVSLLPKVWIKDNAVDAIAHGAYLSIPGIAKLNAGIKKQDLAAVMSLKGELIAFGNALLTSEEIMGSEKGVAVKVTSVFYERGIYPRFVRKDD
ncbi:MAG: RNA-guided pseudouridylation complex pseudouridine synthase subunit Cbf5 [Candidatus Woesearchaeota archaeon]